MHTYIPICPPSCVSLPPSLSHPLGGHKAPSRCPCAIQLLPTSYLFYIWQCIYVHATLSLRPSLPFPHPMSLSPFCTSAYLFLSCPQVLQNHFFVCFFVFVFFLDSIYMCQHPVFVFLFLTYFTLYDKLYVHPHHYKQRNFGFFMAE